MIIHLGGEKMIYFDNAATSFPKPETVYESVFNVMKNYGANQEDQDTSWL